ncbi:MAG: hypothetical protein ABTS16_00750 [Candidatus Accumulibacter phosphatis]|uniref:Glycoside hydrolase family 5 domain-containing protein n=1 Tax=Candidatus Accumulibacter contiguus TaxID=2954381 RepID=A0ABX1T705_9PROT|nr:hypothetical protein [Candidatus Accumulibacter contiguus]NMQ04592.1 hypothetical protein [Candidatus Accumulibacter contiguus]
MMKSLRALYHLALVLTGLSPTPACAQAVGYNPVTGLVTIPSVRAGNEVFVDVQLRRRFQAATLQFDLVAATPGFGGDPAVADYDTASGRLSLPLVRVAGDRPYAATLQHVGNSVFELRSATPVAPPPAWDALRSGHPFTGLNVPWQNYGRDFGANLWGYVGLASEGVAGWHHETRGSDGAALRLRAARQTTGTACLGVDVALVGNPANSAIVLFPVEDAATQPPGATLDLRGQTLKAQVFVPAGARGPSFAPTGLMLFAQDRHFRWSQTPWRNLSGPDGWVTLSVTTDELAAATPQFDTAHVRAFGFKLGVNTGATDFAYRGSLCLDNVGVSGVPPIGFDFESGLTRTETEFRDIASKAMVARYWLFADLRAGVRFATDGSVSGLDDRFLRDLDELVRVARTSGVYLILTLFDFLLGAEPVVVDGVRTFGRAALITDTTLRRSLLDNALRPLFQRYADEPVILAYDVINEPEWLLTDITIPAGKRPAEIRTGGVVSRATMRSFIGKVAEVLHAAGGRQLLTVGSASPRWVGLWRDLVDIDQFHWWAGPGQIDEGSTLPAPAAGRVGFIGEFAAPPAALCTFIATARTMGHVAAMPWSYRAKDGVSAALIGNDGHCP